MDAIAFTKLCDFPDEGGHMKLVDSSVSCDGYILLLYALPGNVTLFPHTEDAAGSSFPVPYHQHRLPHRMCRIGDDGVRVWTNLPDLKMAYPQIAIFPEGRILIVNSRSQISSDGKEDLNAAIYDPDTGNVSKFSAGDGIEHVAIDGAGRVWLGFFDEGVFGGPGVGAGGLVCLGSTGTELFSYNARDDKPDFIDDCYAMNVSSSDVWAYYYSAFHLVHLSNTFQITQLGSNHPAGCEAVAVGKTALLFAGGYDQNRWRLHRRSHSSSNIGNTRSFVATCGHQQLKEGRWIGVGDRMFFLSKTAAYYADVDPGQ